MQWLIDIIKEWIEAQGYTTEDWVNAQGFLTQAYFDRGDAYIYDFRHTNLTFDSAWHDMDLSGIVPAGAKAVELHVYGNATAVGDYFVFRTKGNISFNNVSGYILPVASVWFRFDSIVALDANRFIRYRSSFASVLGLYITVKGWWL